MAPKAKSKAAPKRAATRQKVVTLVKNTAADKILKRKELAKSLKNTDWNEKGPKFAKAAAAKAVPVKLEKESSPKSKRSSTQGSGVAAAKKAVSKAPKVLQKPVFDPEVSEEVMASVGGPLSHSKVQNLGALERFEKAVFGKDHSDAEEVPFGVHGSSRAKALAHAMAFGIKFIEPSRLPKEDKKIVNKKWKSDHLPKHEKKNKPKKTVAKKAAGKKRVNRLRAGKRGIFKPMWLSVEMASITGHPVMSRVDMIKAVWKYVMKNKLMDGQFVVPDPKLEKIFPYERIHFLECSKWFQSHLIQPWSEDDAEILEQEAE